MRYIAKFSDGFVAEIANSKREYTHGLDGDRHVHVGSGRRQ